MGNDEKITAAEAKNMINEVCSTKREKIYERMGEIDRHITNVELETKENYIKLEAVVKKLENINKVAIGIIIALSVFLVKEIIKLIK